MATIDGLIHVLGDIKAHATLLYYVQYDTVWRRRGCLNIEHRDHAVLERNPHDVQDLWNAVGFRFYDVYTIDAALPDGSFIRTSSGPTNISGTYYFGGTLTPPDGMQDKSDYEGTIRINTRCHSYSRMFTGKDQILQGTFDSFKL
ncbi:MAG: hypothetical protein M3Q81_04080 [bacterium]|nr:hypothetical protein [bacterium]